MAAGNAHDGNARERAIEGRRVVALMMAVIGLCQILTITGPAGKLEI